MHSNSCYTAAEKIKFETSKIEAEKVKEVALEEARRTTEIQSIETKGKVEVERINAEVAKIKVEKEKIGAEMDKETEDKCRVEAEEIKRIDAEKDKEVKLEVTRRDTMLMKMQEETKLELEKQKTAKLNIELEREKLNTIQNQNKGKMIELLHKLDPGHCTSNVILDAISMLSGNSMKPHTGNLRHTCPVGNYF